MSCWNLSNSRKWINLLKKFDLDFLLSIGLPNSICSQYSYYDSLVEWAEKNLNKDVLATEQLVGESLSVNTGNNVNREIFFVFVHIKNVLQWNRYTSSRSYEIFAEGLFYIEMNAVYIYAQSSTILSGLNGIVLLAKKKLFA